MDTNGRVTIGNINPGLVSSDYMAAVLGFVTHDSKDRAVVRSYLPWYSSGLLDICRNMVVKTFLDTSDHEWLWFLDSDIEINNSTLYSMLDVASPDERPVVTGIYPIASKNNEIRASVYHRVPDPELGGKIGMVPFTLDELSDPVVDVDGCGAGCLLIHRSILLAMQDIFPIEKPWFDMLIFDQVAYGEDFTFCMRVHQMGFPVTCATDARVNHNKTIKLALPQKEVANVSNA